MNFHPGAKNSGLTFTAIAANTLAAANKTKISTISNSNTTSSASLTNTKPKMGKKKSDIYSCFQILPVKNKANKSIFMCKFCDRQYLQNATKMESHIVTQCQKVPPEVRISYAKVPGGSGGGPGATSTSGGNRQTSNNNNNNNYPNHSPAASDNTSSESRPDTPVYLSQMAAANRARHHHHNQHQNQQQQLHQNHQVKRSSGTGSPSSSGGGSSGQSAGINLVVKRGAGGTLVAQQVSSLSQRLNSSQQQNHSQQNQNQNHVRGNSDIFMRNSSSSQNSNTNTIKASSNKRPRLLLDGLGGITVNVNHIPNNSSSSRRIPATASSSSSTINNSINNNNINKFLQLRQQQQQQFNSKQSSGAGVNVSVGGGATTGSHSNNNHSFKNIRSSHHQISGALPSKVEQNKLSAKASNIIDHKELLEIWKLLAQAIYATGNSVSLCENEYWKRVFKKIRPGLTLPTTDALSNTLLKEEHARVSNSLLSDISECTFVTLQCESHAGNCPEEKILSFFVSTPSPVLFRIVRLSEKSGTKVEREAKTQDKVLEAISSTIDSTGCEKVLAFISDAFSPLMKSYWETLRSQYPGLITFGCIFKGLNSLLDSFLGSPSIREICRKGKYIVDGTKGSSVLKKRFQEIQRQLKLAPITGFKFSSKSKWSSLAKCLALLNSQKAAFKQLVKCEEAKEEFGQQQCKSLQEVCEEDNLFELSCSSSSAMSVDELLKASGEPTFWSAVKSITNIIVPLSNWIKIMEHESSPSISQVPQIFHELKLAFEANLDKLPEQHDSSSSPEFFLSQLASLRRLCVNELHYAACLLNPKLRSKGILTQDEEEEGSEFIHYFCETRQFDAQNSLRELAEYRKKSGEFANSSVWKSAENLDPISWWNSIGPGFALGTVAVHLLEINPSLSTFDPSALVATVPSIPGDIHLDRWSKMALIKYHLQIQNLAKKLTPMMTTNLRKQPQLITEQIMSNMNNHHTHNQKEDWSPQPEDFKLEEQEPMDVTQFLSQKTTESHRNIYSDTEDEDEVETTEDTKNNNVITLDNANATSILSNLIQSNPSDIIQKSVKNGGLNLKKQSPSPRSESSAGTSPVLNLHNNSVPVSANFIASSEEKNVNDNQSNADDDGTSSSSSSSSDDDGSSSSSSSSSDPNESSNNQSTL